MKNLIILKIGGSVITKKLIKELKVNYENLERVSKEIAFAYNPEEMSLILIHGAGSFGHVIVKETGIDEGIESEEQLKAFAETQRLQNKLNTIVTEYLINQGLPAIPCQASSFAVMSSKKLIRMDTEALKGFLKIGMTPVFYGVPAYDKDQKCSILSGDQIASFLAKELEAQKIIHGTDVDGVFDKDPYLNSEAILIPEINSENINKVKKLIAGSRAVDVTKGMFGKVSEILESETEGQIVNALVPGNISKALKGGKIGTMIKIQ